MKRRYVQQHDFDLTTERVVVSVPFGDEIETISPRARFMSTEPRVKWSRSLVDILFELKDIHRFRTSSTVRVRTKPC